MNIRRLKSPVALVGPNFLGRARQIVFRPTELPGWYWRVDGDGTLVPIDLCCVRNKNRRLALVYDKKAVEVAEHFTLLRFWGVEGVIISSDQWGPYPGRALEYLEAMRPALVSSQDKARWCTVASRVEWGFEGAEYVFEPLRPGEELGLTVEVVASYDGLGEVSLCRHLPDDRALEADFGSFTQGLPHRLFYLSWLGGALGWPHHDHVSWYHALGVEKAREAFIRHRLSDFLGALALLDHQRLPAGRIKSVGGSHLRDILFLRELVSGGIVRPV